MNISMLALIAVRLLISIWHSFKISSDVRNRLNGPGQNASICGPACGGSYAVRMRLIYWKRPSRLRAV